MRKTMPVLAHRDFGGEGLPPLLILHGLLGSSRNWQSAGRDLAERFHVHALDLRNHGDSFHAPAMDYPMMADDVVAWMDARALERAHVVGHSMGGKVAMTLACRRPERLGRVVVVDIAPKAYPGSHEREFAAMRALDPATLASRADAERGLEPLVGDWPMRQFLLSNLERAEGGGFRWMINLPGLAAALPVLEATFLEAGDAWAGDMLFLLGERSRYFTTGDEVVVLRHFPRATFLTLAGVGHNPHFEARPRFVDEVVRFLEEGPPDQPAASRA